MIVEHKSLRRGLIGAWCPSLGDSGFLLRGRAPGSSNAVLGTAVSIVGRPGGVAVLPAGTAGSRIDLGASSSLTPLSTVTVAYWFLRTSSTGQFGVQHGDSENNRTFFAGGSDGNVYVGGRYAAGDRFNSISLASLPLNTWHHFVGQITTGTTTRSIWLNGVQQSTTGANVSSVITAFPSVTTTVDIGERFTGSGTQWANSVHDDIRIYNRALTLAEIRLLASRRGIGLVPRRQRRPSAGALFSLNVGGVWKSATPWIKVGGVWKQAVAYTKQGGVWK